MWFVRRRATAGGRGAGDGGRGRRGAGRGAGGNISLGSLENVRALRYLALRSFDPFRVMANFLNTQINRIEAAVGAPDVVCSNRAMTRLPAATAALARRHAH